MYKAPKLYLIEHNIIRDHFLPQDKQKGIWPQGTKTMNQALDSIVKKKYSLKSLRVYVPYQRYFAFPNPTYGSFFRIQTHLWVYWYQFNLNQYCIQLDLGAKQKRMLLEKELWLRKSKSRSTSIWPYFQRASSFDTFSNSFIQWNSNATPLYFSAASGSSVFWFEENLPNLRLLGWNFYSRLHSQSLDTLLSQSIFDGRALQRRSPWSSSTLWLSSPIHDYGVLISDLLSTDSIILSEKYFQYRKGRQRMASYWSQLWSIFWKGFSNTLPWSSLSFFFSFSHGFDSYLALRLAVKQGLKLSPLFLKFAQNSNLLPFSLASFSSLFFFFVSSITFQMKKVVPSIQRSSKADPAKCRLFLFPQKKLYTQYLRKKAFLYPMWVTSTYTVYPRLARLNYFWTVLFQTSYLNPSLKPFQFLLIWFFFFQEMQQSAGAVAHISRSLDRVEPYRQRRLEIFQQRGSNIRKQKLNYVKRTNKNRFF